MPLITEIITETDPVLLAASQSVTTLTTQVIALLTAAPGQTITFLPDSPSSNTPTPCTITPQSILTLTATELEIILQEPGGNVWTTLTYEVEPNTSLTHQPGETNYVIGPEDRGWKGWSKTQKGGCVAGAVLGGLALLGLILCLRSRKKVWVAFSSHHTVGVPQVPVAQPYPEIGRSFFR